MPSQPGWFPLHLHRRDFGEFNFVGYQNTLSFMGGPNERSEEEIETEVTQIEDKLDRKTILVTHGPISGVLDGGHGSPSLARLLDRHPFHAHIHGHSHFNFGRSGNHFNVAAGREARAMLIDLETLQHQVLCRGSES